MMKLNKSQVSWDNYMFGGNRLKCLKRDGFSCVKCGMDNEAHKIKFGFSLSVDHIDRNGKGVKASKKNNDLSNLQTLCLTCHGIKDAARRKLTQYQIDWVRRNPANYSGCELARIVGCSRSNIRWITKGVTWKTKK